MFRSKYFLLLMILSILLAACNASQAPSTQDAQVTAATQEQAVSPTIAAPESFPPLVPLAGEVNCEDVILSRADGSSFFGPLGEPFRQTVNNLEVTAYPGTDGYYLSFTGGVEYHVFSLTGVSLFAGRADSIDGSSVRAEQALCIVYGMDMGDHSGAHHSDKKIIYWDGAEATTQYPLKAPKPEVLTFNIFDDTYCRNLIINSQDYHGFPPSNGAPTMAQLSVESYIENDEEYLQLSGGLWYSAFDAYTGRALFAGYADGTPTGRQADQHCYASAEMDETGKFTEPTFTFGMYVPDGILPYIPIEPAYPLEPYPSPHGPRDLVPYPMPEVWPTPNPYPVPPIRPEGDWQNG